MYKIEAEGVISRFDYNDTRYFSRVVIFRKNYCTGGQTDR